MEDEFKKIFKLNSECLLKYIAYKYFQEGNYFIIQNHEFSNISKINYNINYDIIQPFFNGIALVHKNDKSTYLLPNTLYNSWNPFFNYKIYADLRNAYQLDYLTPNNYVDMTNKYYQTSNVAHG